MGPRQTVLPVDTYGHLVPGADIAWADKLDIAPIQPQLSATYTQSEPNEPNGEALQLLENAGGPARIRT